MKVPSVENKNLPAQGAVALLSQAQANTPRGSWPCTHKVQKGCWQWREGMLGGKGIGTQGWGDGTPWSPTSQTTTISHRLLLRTQGLELLQDFRDRL